ncbi:TetR/AcrR family transcriptional regulator [uncultured Psychroserpens sp.]|uniref:TetR/AcrR family transcriptional regulator n=1 Tax=uncultured Psychroserpens sp. TaxID=255436 RepID=UPI00261491DF|nr:TetR/AcrR family transcriptional regulator [uncultured Psychroserpens sp.]
MKTKDKIKNTSRELFNSKGFKNVTLREVAKELSISYGNVTYHFKTKNQLILCLYQDMLKDTGEIINTFDYNNLLIGILDAPKITFEISIKYLFFYVDFIEIKRSYSDLSLMIEQDNSSRKKRYLQILKQLKIQGVLRDELTDNDLDYLMDLSGAMRTFFFINLNPNDFFYKGLKTKYVVYVNNLIFPYLSAEGMKQYRSHLE